MNFSVVSDLSDFYKSKLPEMTKIKALVDNIKLLFNLPADRVIVEVAEGERVYKFTTLTTDVKKLPFGYFVYMPLLGRLDAYSIDNPFPLIQWKQKKPVYKGYSVFLDKCGLDRVFDKIINVI